MARGTTYSEALGREISDDEYEDRQRSGNWGASGSGGGGSSVNLPSAAPQSSGGGGWDGGSAAIAALNAKYGGQGVEAEDVATLAGKNPEDRDAYLRDLEAKQQRRTAPTSYRNFDSQSANYNQTTNQLSAFGQANTAAKLAASQNPAFGSMFSGGDGGGYGMPGTQFNNDPYSKLLEQMAGSQLSYLQQPQANPAMDKLLAFLDTRFNDLSSAPGYSPEEQALLRTQALDPIERDRAASQRRSLDRTATRGMLPSSGLAEIDSREVDLNYDQLRGAAQRDLGVNAIQRRDQDLAQALGIGQLAGVAIPGIRRSEDMARRAESLNLGSMLYNMPRQAMIDSLAVVNGSPAPGDNFSQAAQLMQQRQYTQQVQDQQNAAFWGQLGETFAGLFGG